MKTFSKVLQPQMEAYNFETSDREISTNDSDDNSDMWEDESWEEVYDEHQPLSAAVTND